MEQLLLQIKEHSLSIALSAITIVLAFVFAKVFMNILSKRTAKAIEKAKAMEDEDKKKSIITSMSLLRSVARYVVYFVAIMISLNALGFGSVFSNLIAAAGIGGLMISFGAQSVVQDVVTGIFLLFEKQYEVGDFVKIGNFEGTVTAVGMRVTYLSNVSGQKIIIPNGQISSVVNYSKQFSRATITVPTPYESNTRKVIEVLKEVCADYYKNNTELFVSEPQVLGVSDFGASSVDILIVAQMKPLNHWQAERDLRLLIKERMDAEGISIPYQQIDIHQK